MVKILIGGSPCKHWSIVRQKKKQNGAREQKAEGIGWELFCNYIIAKEKFKPDYFLYENNESINKDIKEQIRLELGIDRLMHIDSSTVSAQERARIYGSNVFVNAPEDRKIMLEEVIENDVQPVIVTMPKFAEEKPRVRANGKSYTITAAGGGGHIPRLLYKGYDIEEITIDNYKEISREMKVCEVERLQTMPEGYTRMLSKTRAMTGLGNGWTAEVIMHIMRSWNIPKDEEIIVLSMFDGIGTGRYCLEKLGYTNIKYYAYEIDQYAIKCAKENYPDIIEMGDAFDVRKEDWKL